MTRISSVAGRPWEGVEAYAPAAGLDAGGKAAGTDESRESREAALEKVQEAKESVSRTTFRMWDRHAEMVKKSQELSKAKTRKDAITRRNRENRERQTELLAEMALENTRRSKWLNAAALERREETSAFANA